MKKALSISDPFFLAAKKGDKEPTIFIYSMDVSELNCNVAKKTRKVVEGNPSDIRRCQYLIGLQRHPSPDLAATGHFWMIRELVQTGVFKQLI